MRNPETGAQIALLLLTLAACDNIAQRRSPTTRADSETSFASHARAVYGELEREPLDPAMNTKIGLFGDMAVGAGELVVMRRYRYRLDSTAFGMVGHMAFQVRDSLARYDPIPIVLTFIARDDTWHLERAEYGHAVSNSTAGVDRHGHLSTPDRPASEEPQTALHRSLRTRLDPWLAKALARVESATSE